MDCPIHENASPYIQWIYSMFGSCVYGYADALSIFLGYASIFCWLNAQVPQMIENYKLKSADGLSLYLLYFWLAGDLGNMFSCVLNHQLPFQTYLSGYFVSTDLILLCQYFCYSNNRNEKSLCTDKFSSHDQSDEYNHFDEEFVFPEEYACLESTKTTKDVGYGTINGNYSSKKTLYMGMLLFGCKLGMGSTISTSTIQGGSTQVVQSAITFGWVLAWVCTSFYILSRVPQIHKNHKRHSTQGLSLALFSFAVCGNITYAASILFHPGRTTESFLESLPYLSGSLGTLFLDAVIFGQFLVYRKQNNNVVNVGATVAVTRTSSLSRILTFESQ
ncbi:PQ loop repeat-domain-containing protein [Parasitella parasitica]|nr:PQ loop repeat-domain-containing protein [Parasitella parasitica]